VSLAVTWCRMAPEVIACDEDPDATYDNRVSTVSHAQCTVTTQHSLLCHIRQIYMTFKKYFKK